MAYAMEQNERKTFRMMFDTSWLTRGQYKVYLVLFEKNEYGVTQIKRKYVHNTMNFINAYEKILDEQLGLMAESLDSLSKYRELIQTFYDEFERQT